MELLRPEIGFVLKTRDGKTGKKCFINIVSHVRIRKPVNAKEEEVSEEHLDRHGMHSLRVPIFVGNPCDVRDKKGVESNAIDMIFNPVVIARCMGGRLVEYYREFTVNLAMKFTEENTPWKLARPPVILKNLRYIGGTGPTESEPRVFTFDEPPPHFMNQQDQRTESQGGGKILVTEVSDKISELDMKPIASTKIGENKKAGGGSAIRKGFLSNTNGSLYPTGSTEGTPPPGAGDPLGWLPEKLRSRVHVVNQQGGAGDAETKRAVEEYASTGRVSQAPGVIPGGNPAKISLESSPPPEEKPVYEITTESGEGEAEEFFLVKIQLPKIENMSDVELDTSAIEFDLKVPGIYKLSFNWPRGKKIDVDSVRAKFLKKSKTLSVSAAILRLAP